MRRAEAVYPPLRLPASRPDSDERENDENSELVANGERNFCSEMKRIRPCKLLVRPSSNIVDGQSDVRAITKIFAILRLINACVLYIAYGNDEMQRMFLLTLLNKQKAFRFMFRLHRSKRRIISPDLIKASSRKRVENTVEHFYSDIKYVKTVINGNGGRRGERRCSIQNSRTRAKTSIQNRRTRARTS